MTEQIGKGDLINRLSDFIDAHCEKCKAKRESGSGTPCNFLEAGDCDAEIVWMVLYRAGLDSGVVTLRRNGPISTVEQ